MKKSLLSLAVLSAASLPAFGESTDSESSIPDLETVVVVSSRQSEPLRRVATSVTVLDEQQLKARGLASLADVLRSVPSVSVTNTGGMGRTTSLQVRGESGFRTLVLMDGIDISDPSNPQGGAHVEHIMSSNLQRVELLRGPQGMLYGADAGGVLDISTRREDEGQQYELSAEGGRYDSQRYNASASGGNDTLDYFLSVAKAETDGFNTSSDDTEFRDDDGYDNETMHGRAGWNLSEQWRVEAVVRDTDAMGEYDRCGGPERLDDCTFEYSQESARVSLAHKGEIGQQELSYTHLDTSRTYVSGWGPYHTEGDAKKLNLTGSHDFSNDHSMLYGVEQRKDTMGDADRDQWALYSEYQGNYADQAFVTLGLRHDDSSDFGSHNSFRASSAYLFDQVAGGAVKLKASYGTGFRAPSLYEVNHNATATDWLTFEPLELPTLSPEESRGLDIGVEYFGEDTLYLEIVLFNQVIENEVGWDGNASGYLQSSGESKSRGVELNTETQVTDTLLLSANYTFTDTEEADGSPRARRPEHLANLGFTYKPTGALSLLVNLRSSAGAEDKDGSSIDDYQVLDASVRYQLNKATTVYIRGENLTDEDYEEVPGYNTAGAAAYAGVEFSF
ncbi:TonB-dependent siderophore receptor [Microbulbifer sp. GL-2]|uniref:TonB-dependent receptor plug domain-containing protein n=1 Tax=Microbulbifer sp. GL-2 TaxID=2591606 RepID=UPI0011631C9F|nr:TonB-dependent receptor [Microbulbifer sp. GL-2]BBM03663.1 TonB-dependent receptor [Microbulbifer sp. GL-2]